MTRYVAPKYNRLSIVLALPRSGTYWSTRLVRPGVLEALHDPLGPVAGDVQALRLQIDAHLGAGPGRLYLADTGGMMFHRALRKAFPGARWGFIFRDRSAVERSLRNLGMLEILPHLPRLERALRDAWAAAPSPVTVRYTDPMSEPGARALWRLATGTMVSSEWIERMRRERLVLDKATQLANVGPAFGLA